jgi:hypothetical protein
MLEPFFMKQSLTDRDEMSNRYRGPSIGASYQISVHLDTRFQRRFFRNQPISNKNLPWWPCLLTDQDGRLVMMNKGGLVSIQF